MCEEKINYLNIYMYKNYIYKIHVNISINILIS